MVSNRSIVFSKEPQGLPVEGEHLTTGQQELDKDQSPPTGGLIVQVNYLSLDPYMRGRLREGGSSYVPPFQLGKPITNAGIATVLSSGHDDFNNGDTLIVQQLSFTEYAILDKKFVDAGNCKKLQNPHNLDPQFFLGPLGMPGLTAYSSLYEIGKPKKGETIFISAASGAVGQVVGQLAKHQGLKVIASVGSDEKLDFVLKDLGFDCGFNYKKEGAANALKRLAPDGIDIYYENVGGEQLEAAIDALKTHGRIVTCGMISQYNLPPDKKYGVKNLFQIVGKQLTMRGFLVANPDFGPKYSEQHQKDVADWISNGSFSPKIHTFQGIDQGIKALLALYSGENFGKAVLAVAPITK